MKKVLIITLALTLVACMSAFATYTRVMTMGDVNTIVHDDNNIWLFPSTICDYPDMVLGEIDDDDFENMGLNLRFGEEGAPVFGFYFSDIEPYDLFDFAGFSSWWGFGGYGWDLGDMPVPNRRIDLFFGTMLGENNFGARLELVSGSQAREYATDDSKESITELGLTLGLTMMEGAMDLAANINMLSWTDEDAAGDVESEPDGCMAFGFKGRYFQELNEKYTLVPHLGLDYGKFGLKVDPATFEMTRLALDAGLGLNYAVAEDVLVVGDFGLMMSNEKIVEDDGTTKDEYKLNVFTLPYFKAGLDATLFSWMDLRVGGTSYWKMQKFEDDAGDKDKWNYVETDFYLGAGFNWGDLYLDTELNPGLISDGFNFISGHGNQMNWHVSLLYDF